MEQRSLLRSLRKTGNHADLTITCGSQTFKVHKCVVCLGSKWFASACEGGRWEEGKTGIIELKAVESSEEEEDFSCDDPAAVACMIDFIYLHDYGVDDETTSATASLPTTDTPDVSSNSQEPEVLDEDVLDWFPTGPKECKKKRKSAWIGSSTGIAQPKGSLTMHTRLYALAVKYAVMNLKETAVKKMQEAVRGTWDREDFAKAIAVAFGATPDGDMGMRDIIMATILSCSVNLAIDPVIEQAINSVDGLAMELIKRQSTSAKRKGY